MISYRRGKQKHSSTQEEKNMKKTIITKNLPGLNVLRFLTLHGKDKLYAEVEFRHEGASKRQTEFIPLEDLRSNKLATYIPDFYAVEGIEASELYKAVSSKINGDWATHNSPTEILLPQGYSYVNGKWVYAIGDTIVNGDGMNLYSYNNCKNNFCWKSKFKDSWQWIHLFCQNGSSVSALLLCSLTPLLYPITKNLNIPSKLAHAYVVGPSSSGKTTFSQLLTSPFYFQGINLGSKKDMVFDKLNTYFDIPILIDDYNAGSSVREHERKLDVVSELIQSISSSSGEILTERNSIDFSRKSILITAEEIVNAFSSINRVVLVRFEGGFDEEILAILKKSLVMYQSFLYDFLEWICKNSTSLTKKIESDLQNSRFDLTIEHADKSAYIGFSRISASSKILKITHQLIIAFLENRVPKNALDEINKFLRDGVNKVISDTLAAVKVTPSGSPVIDFIIDVFCRDNNEIVAEDYEDYRDSKKISVFEKLFFRYKNEFFFRAEEVANYISMKFKKDVTPSYVIKELSKANLLSYNKEGTSHHLPNKIRKKYDNDKRYSTLNIEVLKDLIIDQRLDFMDYYTSPIKELTPYN